jgi:quercetin dioxygenase-like cupin family protein
MNAADFATVLRAEGFAEAIARRLPAGTAVPEHTHDFAAKVLVTAGAFTLIRDGAATTTYRPGDMFTVPAGCPHAEQIGPEGAEYLAGRRQPTG